MTAPSRFLAVSSVLWLSIFRAAAQFELNKVLVERLASAKQIHRFIVDLGACALLIDALMRRIAQLIVFLSGWANEATLVTIHMFIPWCMRSGEHPSDCGICGCSLKRPQALILPNRIKGIRMASFHEKVEQLKSAISRAEMYVNQGGDPQSVEAGPVRAELVDAWDEFTKEFTDASVQTDA